jgi:acyl-CoA synthetase (AMP-forming)/AMP-acid ligase II
VKFFVMYGATEATARMAYLPPEHAARKAGSIGCAVPGGELALVDDCGAALTFPQLQGELVYRGANVMMGYAACRDDLSRGDDLGGTLPTGDLAYFDEEGFYYICGRRSRFVKILGKRFELGDIEDHLAGSGWSCVCGGADDRLLVAWHRDNYDGGGAALGELKRKLCTTFNIPGDLVQFFRIREIPRTPSGKIRYGEIFTAFTSSKEGGYDGRDEQSEG